MDTLRAYFLTAGLTEKEASDVASLFVHKTIRKGDYFVEEGKTSRWLGYLESGFLQYYVIIEGEEKTTYSVGEHSFVASLVSFLRQVPARENIRAVVDSELWVIERQKVQELVRELPSFSSFYTGILEWQICCIDESRLDAIMLSAKERYQKMLVKEPGLVSQIPLQYLASILGITPRHLSRIRNEIRH